MRVPPKKAKRLNEENSEYGGISLNICMPVSRLLYRSRGLPLPGTIPESFGLTTEDVHHVTELSRMTISLIKAMLFLSPDSNSTWGDKEIVDRMHFCTVISPTKEGLIAILEIIKSIV